MSRDQVKAMLCAAIDNIPECANVMECVVCHTDGAPDASIVVHIQMLECALESENAYAAFHDSAQAGFGTGMDYVP